MMSSSRASLLAVPLAALLLSAPAAHASRDYRIPTQDSGPASITRGPDGALWFAETKANKAGRITKDGAITELPLKEFPIDGGTVFASDYVDTLITGTDGRLYFRTNSGTVLGRIDPATRAIDYFDVPQFSAFTGGPDGGAWLAGIREGLFRFDGTAVDRVNTGAEITCEGLTTGPGNTVWCGHDAEIRRFDLAAGQIRRFALGGESVTDVHELATGPDKAIWYTRYLAGDSSVGFAPGGYGTIGRLRPDGSVKHWRTPGREIPSDLQVGPDRALWFVLADEGIGRITTGGKITVAKLPGRTSGRFAFGPDGAIWIADYQANRITRLTVEELFGPRLRSSSLRYRGGRIKIKLACPTKDACKGRLALAKQGASLARGSYRVAGGKTRTITVRPTRRGRSLLTRSRAFRVTVQIRPRGVGENVNKTLRLVR